MHAHTSMNSSRHFELLGKIAWLWMNSTLHRDWPMRLASQFLLPPIESEQCHLLERDGMPVAYCSWAWLDADAELAYLRNPAAMLANNWRSGERLWFVDWVAPFEAGDSWQLRRVMMARFPQDVARAIRVKRHSTRARVMEFKGPALPSRAARERLDHYYLDTLHAVQASIMPDLQSGTTGTSLTDIEGSDHG